MENVIKKDYFTEKDLIERYANNRKNMPIEDVEDLYRAFVHHFNKKILSPKEDKPGFKIEHFFTFLRRELKTEDLIADLKNSKYKRAEDQLRYALSGKSGINYVSNSQDNKE